MFPPTRREFLCATASLLAREENQQPLGFSLYGMKTLPLSRAIRICGAIGYNGVELACMPGYPAEPKKLNAADRKGLRSRLADAKLQLHGLMENLAEPAPNAAHRKNLERLKRAAELGNALSPDRPPPIESVLGGRPKDWDRVKNSLVERLADWAEAGKQARTVIAVKAHVSNALHTVEGAKWLIEQVNSPWLRLAFDYSHFVLRGVKLADAITALIPLSVFVHVKDAKGSPEKVQFLLPGEQGIDYGEYSRLLVSARYRGPVVVEVSGMVSGKPGYDPEAAARKCYTNLTWAFGRGKR